MKKRPERILRVLEVSRVLKDPKNKVQRSIRTYGIPFGRIAHSVVWAEMEGDAQRKTLAAIRHERQKATQKEKDANAKIERQINRIEKEQEDSFSVLPPDVRMKLFFKCDIFKAKSGYVEGNRYVRELASAHIKKALAVSKIRRWSGSRRKPAEKGLQRFCRAMNLTFTELGQKPDYRLIANIANLFNLSKMPQNYNSIKTRFSRNNF